MVMLGLRVKQGFRITRSRKSGRLQARPYVAKMASHAIFEYNVLAINDTHNTWTNICVKMIIIRFIGPRDEKIKDPEETKSKRSEQRQFTITG